MTTAAFSSKSGWVTFAGIAALVAGAYNGLSALSTLTSDYPRIEQVEKLLFGVSVDTWAWFWLVVGRDPGDHRRARADAQPLGPGARRLGRGAERADRGVRASSSGRCGRSPC